MAANAGQRLDSADLPLQEPVRESSGHSRLDPAAAVLAVWPLVLLAVNPNWLFSNLYNDAWIYFGYFLNLPNHLRAFNGVQYFSSRLTVLVPGYLAHRALPTVPAHVVLHLGLYYASLFLIYALLKRTVGPRSAFLTALLVGSNFFFQQAMGWDYVDAFGITYLCLAMALLALGTSGRRWRVSAVGAGAATAALVVANPGYVFLVPSLALSYAATHGLRGDTRWPAVGALFVAGALALVAACAALSWWWAGSGWFMGPTVRWVAAQAGKPNPFQDVTLQWLPRATWLLLPTVALACTAGWLARLVRWGRQATGRAEAVFHLQWIAACAAYAFNDLRLGGVSFQSWFYTSLLIPSSALVIGSALAKLVDPLERTRFLRVAAAAVGVQLIAAAVPTTSLLALLKIPPLVLALILAGGAMLLLSRRPTGWLTWFAALGLLGMAQVVARDGFEVKNSFPQAMWYQSVGMRAYDDRRVDLLRLIADAERAVLSRDPTGNARFWYRLGERHGLVFKAIACTHCDGPRTLGVMFPRLNPGAVTNDGKPAPPRMLVVVLTSSPDTRRVVDFARYSLGQEGFTSRLAGLQRLRRGGIELTMIFLQARRAAR